MSDPRLDAAIEIALARGEHALQVAAYVDGDLVVDAAVGEIETGPVTVDHLFAVQSVTKGFVVTCLHLQAERGLLDYDDEVARHWPEFSANGKGDLTIAHVLSHRSGLPAPEGLTVERCGDWDWMSEAIAASRPTFTPGEKGAYQTIVFGYVVGELVRRTDPAGRSIATFVREEVCDPLGIDDFFFTLTDDQRSRLVPPLGSPASGRVPTPLTAAAVPPSYVASLEGVEPHRHANPSSSGAATARAAARLFAMLANGGELDGTRLLSDARVQTFATPRAVRYEYDEVIGFVPLISTRGFWLGDDGPLATPVVGGPRALSHPGAGGTSAWADPDLRLGAAITHDRMIPSYPPPTLEEHPLQPIGEALRAIARERLRVAAG